MSVCNQLFLWTVFGTALRSAQASSVLAELQRADERSGLNTLELTISICRVQAQHFEDAPFVDTFEALDRRFKSEERTLIRC